MNGGWSYRPRQALQQERARIFRNIRRRQSQRATPAEVERLAEIKDELGGDAR